MVFSLKNVPVYQHRDHLVLSNVTLSLDQGEFAYLIGKTGSGKSSLLKILYGDLPLKGGQAQVVGYDLGLLKRKDIPYLRRKIGVIFQDFQLLNDRSVNNNLRFVLQATGWKDKRAIDRRIEEALDAVGMTTKGFKKPFELSGGEQQRIVISRALLNDPLLIVADEPTGNLDPETSNEVLRVLLNVSQKKNCAVLMASHDFSLIKQFPSKTYRCIDGAVKLAEQQSFSL